MKDLRKWLLMAALVITLVSLFSASEARWISGKNLKTKQSWQYIAKFCYVGKTGGLTGSLAWTVPTDPGHHSRRLLLYWDQPDTSKQGSWAAVYNNKKMSCAEKSNFTSAGGNVDLAQRSIGETTIGNSYPHYWWVVIADCPASSQTIQTYSLHFLNFGGSELSCDEQGLPAMYIVFFVFFLLLVFVHIYSVIQLYRAEALHPIIRLVSICIACQLLAMLFYMIHYTKLEKDGKGVTGLRAFADFLNMGADLSIILLIILVSKGWAVTTNVIPKRDTIIILICMVILAILYLTLFIWDYATAESALVYYFYQSVPGILVLVLRALVGFWFLFNIIMTLKLETLPEKRSFYIKWAIIFGSWIGYLPLFVLIIGSGHVWIRLKAISAASEVVDFLIMCILLYFTWPSLARRYFSVMPGKTLLGYDFLSGESTSYVGNRNPNPTTEGRAADHNPFSSSSSDL